MQIDQCVGKILFFSFEKNVASRISQYKNWAHTFFLHPLIPLFYISTSNPLTMSNSPDKDVTTIASIPPTPTPTFDPEKVAQENVSPPSSFGKATTQFLVQKAIATALRNAQLENQALTSQLQEVHIRHSDDKESTSSISTESSGPTSEATTESWKKEIKQSAKRYMTVVKSSVFSYLSLSFLYFTYLWTPLLTVKDFPTSFLPYLISLVLSYSITFRHIPFPFHMTHG